MTAYAAPRTTYRPYLPPLGEGALDGVRTSLRQWGAAFRVARPAARPGVDAFLLSARD